MCVCVLLIIFYIKAGIYACLVFICEKNTGFHLYKLGFCVLCSISYLAIGICILYGEYRFVCFVCMKDKKVKEYVTRGKRLVRIALKYVMIVNYDLFIVSVFISFLLILFYFLFISMLVLLRELINATIFLRNLCLWWHW